MVCAVSVGKHVHVDVDATRETALMCHDLVVKTGVLFVEGHWL